MSWLYVPGLEGSSLGLDSRQGDLLARSATSRGRLMPLRYWLRVWGTAPWIQRLSGVTSTPSTVARGVTAWIYSLRATHANLSAKPVRGLGSLTLATCGPTLPASFTSVAPASCSARTSPLICTTDSRQSPETWKRWVTELRQHCTRRRSMVPGTSGSACSGSLVAMLPTPKTEMRDCPAERLRRSPNLGSVVAMLPTPTALSYGTNQGGAAGRVGKVRPSLAGIAGGSLNPEWVEWLMGWPEGWTDCERSVTESYRKWLRAHFWN